MIDSDSPSREERLVQLIEGLTEKLHAGENPSLDEVVQNHPEFEGDLRELWGAILITEGVAREAKKVSEDSQTQLFTDSLFEPTQPSWQTPSKIGEFKIIREIGRGGMGVVYEAEQQNPNRKVALKMLLQGQLAPETDFIRFQSEAQAVAQLDHNNIVALFEVGSHENIPYFTLRLIEGENLATKITREGPLSPREAAQLLSPICAAIHYAHSKGVLHRDLKPSNILLDDQGTPYVTDFGLAKRMEAGATLTQSGAILGTPSFMAPEQAQGNRGKISPQSDVFSLGSVLYYLVTGRPPFQAQTPLDTVLSVLEQDPPLPRLINPNIDRDFEMIIMRCLQKPSELRYQSAQDLARDLEAYINGDSLSVKSLHIKELLSRMFRSTHHAEVMENWGLLWMLHSVVLVVLCGLTNLLKHWGHATPFNCLMIWSVGFSAWAGLFWSLRRRAGPITFVEKQIAHVWGASILGSSCLFFVEIAMDLPALTLSPILAVIGGIVFFAKAGILTGQFYITSLAMFLTAFLMTRFKDIDIILFGLVSATSFFLPGLKYYRIRKRDR